MSTGEQELERLAREAAVKYLLDNGYKPGGSNYALQNEIHRAYYNGYRDGSPVQIIEEEFFDSTGLPFTPDAVHLAIIRWMNTYPEGSHPRSICFSERLRLADALPIESRKYPRIPIRITESFPIAFLFASIIS